MLNAWLTGMINGNRGPLSGAPLLQLIHAGSRQPMVGMENSAPSLMPEGQREVTVLVRV
jgi:hypothetical protein